MALLLLFGQSEAGELANCIDCGNRIGFTNNGGNGRCSTCNIRHSRESNPIEMDFVQVVQEDNLRLKKIDAVLLTTETATNFNVIKRIEIVTAECAFGMNLFKDLAIAVSNVVGGRSETVQKAMRESRKTALYELKREAHSIGANAVVGVDLKYVELGSAASNMIMIVASGTAVEIEIDDLP